MSNCNKHTVPCGCGSTSLTTAAPCDSSGACAGENCAEVFSAECIYVPTEMSLSIGGNTFTVDRGMRVDAMLQKLMIFTETPACADTAAVGLRMTSIGSTTATIAWSGDVATNYEVEWSSGVPITEAVIGALSLNIINLVAETEYTIKVTNTDDACESVILTFTTSA